MKALTLLTISLIATSSVAMGQSRQVPAAEQSTPILFIGGEIHPVSSAVIPDGWVLVSDGRIDAVGSGVVPELPEGCREIQLDGRRVYPGLIAADSELGLTETEAVDVTHDYNEYGTWTPEAQTVVALNPDSDLIPVTRAAGVLTALVNPSGGKLAGQSTVIRLDGWTYEDLAIVPQAALVLEWPRGGRRGGPSEDQIREIDEFFDAADAYYLAREHDETVKPDLRYESMRAAVNNEVPLLVRASTAAQIEAAASWSASRDLDIVILGGEESDRVADLLIAEDIPVIVRGVHRAPISRHMAPHTPHELPGLLHKAGVRFCIAPRDRPAHIRNLAHHAATAAAHGLPRDVALRSVTLDAAEIIGVSDRLGSLEPGKSATLIITSGDPLEMMTDVEMAFIDGREIDLSSRHTQLRDKYREKYTQKGRLK